MTEDTNEHSGTSNCSPSSLINGIALKWRRRYSREYDVIHRARALYFYRWELKVDTAGGIYSARSFRVKSDLHQYRRSQWRGRQFWVYDCWSRETPEMLADMKVLAKLLGWKNYTSIHDAPLAL
jgi:hypothetical protein